MHPKMNLPLNCDLDYIESFLTMEEAQKLYDLLVGEYDLPQYKTRMEVNGVVHESDYGKIMFLDQGIYDRNEFPEAIWGKTQVWTEELLQVKEKIETMTGRVFGVGVCIYYPDGNSGVDFHSDPSLYGDTRVIPSLSLGEERAFYLREKESLEQFEVFLQNGSLLIMGEHCQERYEHCLPINPEYKQGRINITFRQFGFAR